MAEERRRQSRRPRNSGHQGRKNRPSGNQPRGPRKSVVDAPRLAAFSVLRTVDESDAYANLVLPPLLRERGITGRDAAFATELTYGTLRMRGRYDAIIDMVSSRPTKDLDAPLADALRLGAHQLLGMRVPDHAAVDATVSLAREVAGEGPANLANAVLRRISERSLPQWLEKMGPTTSDGVVQVPQAAAHYSHPEWIVRAIRQSLGSDAGELLDALDANNQAPAVTLAQRPGLSTDSDLPTGVEPGRWAPTARVLSSGDPGDIPAVARRLAGVQDEGSQLVTLALAAAPIEGPDATWLDLCAGPGGKSALLGALLAQRDPQATLIANEVAPHRVRLVQDSVRGVLPHLPGLHVRQGDGREVGESEPERYDRVLVDAPCTGLGALRRRPEARWRRSATDLAQLTALQRELLDSALHATRPGGVVAYVTCSPHVAETSLVVTDVLKNHPEAKLLDAAEVMSGVTNASLPDVSGQFVQLWPHRHGTDAMFLALIAKASN